MKLIQSVGFLDMHPLQVKALMDLVKLTIKTAAQSNEQVVITKSSKYILCAYEKFPCERRLFA